MSSWMTSRSLGPPTERGRLCAQAEMPAITLRLPVCRQPVRQTNPKPPVFATTMPQKAPRGTADISRLSPSRGSLAQPPSAPTHNIAERTHKHPHLQRGPLLSLPPTVSSAQNWRSKTKPLTALPSTKLPEKRTHRTHFRIHYEPTRRPLRRPCLPLKSGQTFGSSTSSSGHVWCLVRGCHRAKIHGSLTRPVRLSQGSK